MKNLTYLLSLSLLSLSLGSYAQEITLPAEDTDSAAQELSTLDKQEILKEVQEAAQESIDLLEKAAALSPEAQKQVEAAQTIEELQAAAPEVTTEVQEQLALFQGDLPQEELTKEIIENVKELVEIASNQDKVATIKEAAQEILSANSLEEASDKATEIIENVE